MPTTLRNTDILFNDGTTQNTAAGGAPSAFNAIGSVLSAINYSTSNLFPGNTIAGSSLLYVTGFSAVSATNFCVEGNFSNNLNTRGGSGMNGLFGVRTGNQGAYQPGNTAFLSGTWRVLSATTARTTSYAGYTNETIVNYASIVVQRIS